MERERVLKRMFSAAMLVCLFVSMLILAFDVQAVRAQPRTWYVDDDGAADFHTIQEAINAASDGDVVFVRNGTYYENLVTNKTLSLLGESRYGTVVDGRNSGDVITMTAGNSSVSEFNVRASGDSEAGVYFEYCGNITVSQNVIENTSIGIFGWISGDENEISENILRNNSLGLWIVSAGSRDTVAGNIVENNSEGIVLHYAYNCSVVGNVIVDNSESGIYFDGQYNRIWGNTLSNNGIGVGLQDAFHNTIWHNNFDNEIQVSRKWDTSASSNTWDYGYPSGGNYWSDYNGTDVYSSQYQNVTGIDGIGDTPHVIDTLNVDRYPLMQLYVRPIGDLNQDGIVNILDAIQAASVFGLYAGDPGWNEQVDINRDGVVNILDIIIIANNFGKQ
jgi:parallel beta-helix repeat protein